MYLNKEDLFKILHELFPHLSSLTLQRKENHPTIYKKTGPSGYFDAHKLLLEQNEAVYAVRSLHGIQEALPDIIFSHPRFQDEIPSKNHSAFIRALFREGFRVWLWNEKIPFREQDPVGDKTEFWQQRTKIQPASSEEVKEILNSQGVASDNSIIIDFVIYEKIIYSIRNDMDNADANGYIPQIELNQLNPDSRQTLDFLKSPSANHIKKVFYNKNDTNRQLESEWKITGISFESGEYFSQTSLTTLKITSLETLHLLEEAQALRESEHKHSNPIETEAIRVSASEKLATLTEEECSQITKIEISGINNISFLDEQIFTKFKNLHHLSIKDMPHLATLDLRQCSQIKSIHLQLLSLTNLDLPVSLSLEKLTLNCEKIKFLDLKNQKSLKKLSLTSFFLLKTLNLNTLDHLESLQLDLCERLKTINFGSSSRNLLSLELKNSDKLEPDFSLFKKLKKISLLNCKKISRVDLTDCPLESYKILGTPEAKIELPKNVNRMEKFTSDGLNAYHDILRMANPEKEKLASLSLSNFFDTLNITHLQLEYLIFSHSIATLDVQHPESIRGILLKDCVYFRHLNFSRFKSLEYLIMTSSHKTSFLETINLSDCRSLKKIKISGDFESPKKIDLTGCDRLFDIEIRER